MPIPNMIVLLHKSSAMMMKIDILISELSHNEEVFFLIKLMCITKEK